MQLSIITLGHVHAEDLASLAPHFERLEQLVLDIPPRDPLSKHRAEFNRAVDAASSDWIAIIREREVIDASLAGEISETMSAAKAWGVRIRSIPFYAGRPLRIGADGGELRLLHKRHYMRFANKGEWDEPVVQGTVVRLANPLRAVTFESPRSHREYLAQRAVPHSWVRNLLLFLRYAIGARTLDRTTLQYLWIEAAFDKS